MRKARKRVLSALLAAVLALGLMPSFAFATTSASDTGEEAGISALTPKSVTTADELKDAIDNAQSGDVIMLGTNVVVSPQYSETTEDELMPWATIKASITLDLNGHTLSWDQTNANDLELAYTACFLAVDGASVTFKDGTSSDGSIDTELGFNNSYGVNIINNGFVAVESGTYTGATSAFQVQTGTLTITGGKFEQARTIAGYPQYAKYVVNCIDDNFKDGTARIYAKGGTFCFDPNGKPENSDVTYVPADYQSFSNDGGTWTVKAKQTTTTEATESGTTVSATVSGVPESASAFDDSFDSTAGTLTIDAAVQSPATSIEGANVTIGGETLAAINDFDDVDTLIIETNVGTLEMNAEAIDSIVDNAAGASGTDVHRDVTLSIEKKTSDPLIYTLTATDAAGTEVFSEDNASGEIVVTVPYTGEAAPSVYFLPKEGSPVKVSAEDVTLSDGKLSWSVAHFSDWVITSPDTVALIVGDNGTTEYSSLENALDDAIFGDTVYLVKSGDLSTAIEEGVTLDVQQDAVLSIGRDNLHSLATSKGAIRVNAGGEIKVADAEMIGGADANICLTEGYIDISIEEDSSLGLDFVGAQAQIPEGNRWTTVINLDAPGTNKKFMSVTFDENTVLTVESSGEAGGENDGFRVANGSALTNNGKIVVNGIMTVSTDGTIEGNGTIENSGIFVFNGSDANDLSGSVALKSGGEVYSQADISALLSGSSYREMSNKTYDDTAYAYAWEYYVAPTPVPTPEQFDVAVADVQNGAVELSAKTAKEGQKVTVTVTPDLGWELAQLTVADEDGDALELTENADGTYSFTMPAGDVTVHASFADAWENPFTDLSEDHWGYGAVRTANLLGLMKGIGGTTLFGPDDGLLREQAATVMWNLMGAGDVSRPEAPQADVDQSQWYAPYVNWAVDSKVMDGYSEDDFGVGDSLTREQFAAVVAKAVGADVDSADQAALGAFPDADGVSGWARATMAWAVEAGVLNGVETEDGSRELQATRELTRAEMATMMVNAIEVGVLDFGA